ncbi:hypothetical protein [Sphingopyxis indica]|nr:hypothetical protein [Sphingopyxis indica]
MMGRIIGGALGSLIGRGKGNHPVAGAVIGAGTLFAARRLFPQRYAVIAATAAAAYLTKKWADRAEARRAAAAAHVADPNIVSEDVVDTYAGIDEPDGRSIGDALPPAIPVGGDGTRPSIH